MQIFSPRRRPVPPPLDAAADPLAFIEAQRRAAPAQPALAPPALALPLDSSRAGLAGLAGLDGLDGLDGRVLESLPLSGWPPVGRALESWRGALEEILPGAGRELSQFVRARLVASELEPQLERGRPALIALPHPAHGALARATFDELVGQVLDLGAGGTVGEERLFAAISFERVTRLAGPEAGRRFLEHLQRALPGRAGGSYAAAATLALTELVRADALTPERARQVRTQAASSAQLERHDSHFIAAQGGPRAVGGASAPIADALTTARARLQAIDRGAELGSSRLPATRPGGPLASQRSAAPRTLDELAGAAPGAPGFLWKPRSESDGKLVVLLPAEYRAARSVRIRDASGRVLARGHFAGVDNGERAHYRFDRAGERYPANVTVEVQLLDGRTRTYAVHVPGQRLES